MAQRKISPLAAPGILLGAGLGGFIDGIVFHQILQFHNMLSSVLPPDNLVDAKVNMYWDGIFHAGVFILTIIGLIFLWKAGARSDVFWSGKAFIGFMLAGWGMFNLVEGIIDHHLAEIHHVFEYTGNKLPYDIAFLLSGVLLLLLGFMLVRRERNS